MSDKQLREAFDRLKPSEETRQVMLDNILKTVGDGLGDKEAVPAVAPFLSPKRRKRSKFFDVALPAAACLILLAGVGSLTLPELFTATAPREYYSQEPLEELPAISEKTPAPAPQEPSSSSESPRPTESSDDAATAVDAAPSSPVAADMPAVALSTPSGPELSPLHAVVSILAIAISLVALLVWGLLKLSRRKKR
jgi:cytoskeletal protein RodZ